jgi:hypothetical protein
MKNLKHDFEFIQSALPEVETYLLSETLYWPLGASLPRLTIGGLLLALKRASALEPFEARKWLLQVESVRAKRRNAWEQKSLRELQNRLRLWSESVSEWRSAEGGQRADYTGEVRGRVIIQILLREVNAPGEQAALDALDRFLRVHLKPASFLWDKGLEQAFDRDEFWFLYGKLI